MNFCQKTLGRRKEPRCVDCCPQVNVSEIPALFHALVTGVESLHARNIIHRDLKPRNFVLVPVRGEEGRILAQSPMPREEWSFRVRADIPSGSGRMSDFARTPTSRASALAPSAFGLDGQASSGSSGSSDEIEISSGTSSSSASDLSTCHSSRSDRRRGDVDLFLTDGDGVLRRVRLLIKITDFGMAQGCGTDDTLSVQG